MPEHNPLLRFDANKTRKTAIAAKCAECMGCTREAIERGFKREIRYCTSRDCPLWEFRPYRPRTK